MFRAHGQIDSLALELRSTACRSISGPPIELTTYSTMSVRPHWAQDQGRTQWRPSTNGDHWSRCLVLSLDGAPIAVASAFMPRLHRSRAWCYVEVVPSARRAGVALMYGEDDTTSFVGGAVERDDADAIAISTELLRRAQRLGTGPLRIELDDWMWEVEAALEPYRSRVGDNAHVVAEH